VNASTPTAPKRLAAPTQLRQLGRLVVLPGACNYFPNEARDTLTAYAAPKRLSPEHYDTAMQLGMRRSGTLVYRPLCPNCRRCQPFRIDVQRFEPSKSQRRVARKCEDLFDIHLSEAFVDQEQFQLYTRYQQQQHGKDGQAGTIDDYARFLGESITDTRAIHYRMKTTGALAAVGIVDVVPSGLSTVYFYWDPDLAALSLGVYAALVEIDLCKQLGLPYYYLGYLVPHSKTMSYKAQFGAGEIWHGDRWQPVPSRNLDDESMKQALRQAEQDSMRWDEATFDVPPTT
jgi:leucyl-tRNA---protein transferase